MYHAKKEFAQIFRLLTFMLAFNVQSYSKPLQKNIPAHLVCYFARQVHENKPENYFFYKTVKEDFTVACNLARAIIALN